MDYMKKAKSYPITLTPVDESEGKGYYVTSTYFPGICVDEETADAAISEFYTVLAEVIQYSVEHGQNLPQIVPEEYSGKMSLRMSKSLHAQLARQAELDGVSINALANQYIAQGLGQPRSRQPVKTAVAPARTSTSYANVVHLHSARSQNSYAAEDTVEGQEM